MVIHTTMKELTSNHMVVGKLLHGKANVGCIREELGVAPIVYTICAYAQRCLNHIYNTTMQLKESLFSKKEVAILKP